MERIGNHNQKLRKFRHFPGNETVSLVRTRARQSLLAEVCLVANAMRQSLLDSKDSAKASQQPMGIRVTVNSSFKNLTKNVLTNASFRTRKLSEESAEVSHFSLSSINKLSIAETMFIILIVDISII